MFRAQKESVVAEVTESFSGVMSLILADYRGLDVNTITAMRDEFRAAGCHYKVFKNALVKIAVKDTALAPLEKILSGPTALIWSNESPSAPAKIAVKYAKEQKDFEIKGGYFEGQLLDANGVESLAKMPGKQELQASLLMTFMAAPTDLVRQLVAGPQNFLYLLSARERSLG